MLVRPAVWKRVFARSYARQVPLPASHAAPRPPNMSRDGLEGQLPIYPRTNVFGNPLAPAPTGSGPVTGFFRNGYCDATPADPASHTVAAVVTPKFLDFSKSRGNDLWSLFPSLRQSAASSQQQSASPCVWCLCASRWYEALKASASHPDGEAIVPRVVLEATHERAPLDGRFDKSELERFAVGGDGTGTLNGGGGGAAAGGAQGRGGGATGEKIGR
ncbi:DUF2237 domain-containing protein [Rhodotorula paludigena]|uniref:DUF2237 domain-containing protein n=1 Tax=Rhodotorula paludigena TaxID=86838 RepID=UPI00317B4855